ncbi:MAG TPA: ribosome-associated translation inhibitor RaiA [Gaiellaceae bacterium]|nr:ribosome-associated translation inhibitor RaiA [Gaiellaceae bacterium]
MRLQIKGRNDELTPEIRSYVESKFIRLERQLAEETEVEIELAEETKHGRFTAEATVFAKGQTLRGVESTSDPRASIDKLAETMERQIVGYREKRRLERRRRTEHHRV